MHADHHGGLYRLLELRDQLLRDHEQQQQQQKQNGSANGGGAGTEQQQGRRGAPAPLLVVGPGVLFPVLRAYQSVVSWGLLRLFFGFCCGGRWRWWWWRGRTLCRRTGEDKRKECGAPAARGARAAPSFAPAPACTCLEWLHQASLRALAARWSAHAGARSLFVPAQRAPGLRAAWPRAAQDGHRRLCSGPAATPRARSASHLPLSSQEASRARCNASKLSSSAVRARQVCACLHASVPQAVQALGLESLTPFPVHHVQHACGVKLVGRRGWSVVFSGDTRPCDKVRCVCLVVFASAQTPRRGRSPATGSIRRVCAPTHCVGVVR